MTPARNSAPASRSTAVWWLAAIVALYALRNVLLPFVLAAVPAYLLTPWIDRLAARTRMSRACYAAGALLVLLGIAGVATVLALPTLSQQLTHLIVDFEGSLGAFLQTLLGAGGTTLLGRHYAAAPLAAHAAAGVQGWLADSQHLALLAGWGFAITTGAMLTVALLGYFLFDAHRIAAGLLWLIPPAQRVRTLQIWQRLDPQLRRYFVGVAWVLVYASVAAYLGLGLVLGLHHAVLLAILTGVLEIIPVVGPLAAAVIAGLIAMEEARTAWSILAYVLYAIALRLSIDQFFGPLVLGRTAQLRPVTVLFAFLAGGALFGAIGVLLAIPAALAIKATLAVRYESEPGHGWAQEQQPIAVERRGALP